VGWRSATGSDSSQGLQVPAHRLRPGRPLSTVPATWQRTLDYMREQHTPIRASDVQQVLGILQAHMVRKRMADAEVIERVAQGLYTV